MFKTIFGHSRLKNILAKMLANDRLPNTICFTGPEGIGKKKMGYEVAKALLCEKGNACGECNHCYKFDQSNHPDFILIEPDGREIKVDQVREVVEGIHFRPFEAKHRVLIMDHAEKMGDSAANAFLKTLEEPPDYVTFILVTPHWDQLLPTIRSRSQRFQFQGLRHEDKVHILKTVFDKDEEWAEKLAAISFGELEVHEEAWEEFSKHIQLGITYFSSILVKGEGISLLGEFYRDRAKAAEFVLHLTELTRTLYMTSQGMRLPDLYKDWEAEMMQLAKSVPPHFWSEALSGILDFEQKGAFYPNTATFFDQFSVNQLGQLEKSQRIFQEKMAKLGKR